MDEEVNNNEEQKRYCKKCNLEIKTKRRKVFCSVKCAKAFHSLKRYHQIKLNPDYKEKRKAYVQTKRGEKKEDKAEVSK
jgi:hypothetical protein